MRTPHHHWSSSEDLRNQCWIPLHNVGNQLSCSSTGIVVSVLQELQNLRVSPSTGYFFSWSGYVQVLFAGQTVLIHVKRTQLKPTRERQLDTSLQSLCPFLLRLYLSSVLLSRYLPLWGEELCFLQCESEWKISQNNDASTLGTVRQKVRMSFGLLLHSRLILADTWPM